MRKGIDGYKLGVALVALLGIAFAIVIFAPSAYGTGGKCEKFTNHSGHVPAGWTATFIEDGKEYGPVVGPEYLSPKEASWKNKTWDKAIKCRTVTTTTAPTTTTTEATTTSSADTTTTTGQEPSTTTTQAEQTTTTSPPSPTTTGPPTTSSPTSSLPSTTVPAPTTTVPTSTTIPDTSTVPDASARWYASGSCHDDGGYIDVELGEGIEGVDVYMWVDIDLGETPAGWGNPGTRFTESGSYRTTVSVPTAFKLVAIAAPGYVADPAEIEVQVDRCTPPTSQASSTSAPEAPQTPATPDLEELPYTGIPLHVWAILGLVALGGGTALVRWAND